MRGTGHETSMREIRNAINTFVGKPEGRRPLERPGLRREDNIRMDHKKYDEKVWTGCIWQRLGTSSWLL
jgi:hypothetical protein